jgi:hypothetical protein
MLNRADMNHIRQNVQYILGTENHELNVDRIITDGLVKFIRHHHTKGQWSKDVQNAIDATLTVACFALPGEEASLCNIASRILGIDKASGKLTHHKNKALEMIASQALFYPKERKTCADAYREEAACCVSDSVTLTNHRALTPSHIGALRLKIQRQLWANHTHSEYGVRWHLTQDMHHLPTRIYKQWQLDKGDKTIGLTSFRAHVCPCMRDPTSKSCVDLIYSQFQEYMASVRNALKYRPSIKHRIELCQCAIHKCARERRAIMELVLDAPMNEEQAITIQVEDGILLWEDLLGGRTSELIGATCCKAGEYTMLACQEIQRARRQYSFLGNARRRQPVMTAASKRSCVLLTAPSFYLSRWSWSRWKNDG